MEQDDKFRFIELKNISEGGMYYEKSNLSACIMYGARNGWMWNESRK